MTRVSPEHTLLYEFLLFSALSKFGVLIILITSQPLFFTEHCIVPTINQLLSSAHKHFCMKHNSGNIEKLMACYDFVRTMKVHSKNFENRMDKRKQKEQVVTTLLLIGKKSMEQYRQFKKYNSIQQDTWSSHFSNIQLFPKLNGISTYSRSVFRYSEST